MTEIRGIDPADGPDCDAIVQSLPHFFGSEAGTALCALAVRTQRGWVTVHGGRVVAFLTIDDSLSTAPEISWMAVHATQRRRGLGRALISHAAAVLRADGARVLSVLTLAASVPEEGTDTYAGTRDFYRRVGFYDVREFRPEGWTDPALLLVRPL